MDPLTVLVPPGTNDIYTSAINNGILGPPNSDYTLINGTQTVTCDTSKQSVFRFTATGAATLTPNLTNPKPGRIVTLYFSQTSLGSVTLVPPAHVQWRGSAPNLTIPASTMWDASLTLRYDEVQLSGAGVWVEVDREGFLPGWIVPTLGSNIANLGSGWQTAGYHVNKERLVTIKGILTGTGLISNALIFQLPVGYRPVESVLANGAAYNGTTVGTGAVSVDTSGNVRVNGTPTGTTIFSAMNGVRFFATG